MSNQEEDELKTILFEIYSAGYVDGHDGLVDIATGYEKWFDTMIKIYISNKDKI